jgi:hypothetical protein
MLKKIIATVGLAGALTLPLTSKAHQDMVGIQNAVQGESHEITIAHYAQATEGFGSFDSLYGNPPFWTWGPKITTLVDGYELESDKRPTNSISSFNTSLGVWIEDSTWINSQNDLRFTFKDNSVYKGPDPNRIYLGKAQVFSNYTSNAQEFIEVKDLRKVAPIVNVYSNWPLTTLNINPAQTNAPGVINYGKLIVKNDFLDGSSERNRISNVSISNNVANLETMAQLGSYIIDRVQVNTNLANSSGWNTVGSYTNYVNPTIEHFDEGWKPINRQADISTYSNSPSLFFRINRTAETTNFVNGASFDPL